MRIWDWFLNELHFQTTESWLASEDRILAVDGFLVKQLLLSL